MKTSIVSMKDKISILIADRNPRVRKFLEREIASEGYKVYLAKNGQEVLKRIFGNTPPDLLISDLDLPDTNARVLLDCIHQYAPFLPIVIHGFISDYSEYSTLLNGASFVEKTGNSVESLKKAISKIFKIDERNMMIRES
jgi:DNA-binding NtrC family response regulator